MVRVKLEHGNLSQYQSRIFEELQTFRKEKQFCDVVLKSHGGTEHQAHKAILGAASEVLKVLLAENGPFREATQVQQEQQQLEATEAEERQKQKQRVEIPASDAVVSALLEYIYGQQPEVELEDSFELLHLADAYNFAELAAAIEAGLLASLDNAPLPTALKVLKLPQHVHELKAACEEKVAAHFETCIDMVDFLNLSDVQLGRILPRADLKVSREEVVVQGLFKWVNRSKDRRVYLGLLLQQVDLRSLASSSLARLGYLFSSMGEAGHDLHRQVGEALQVRKKRSAEGTPDAFRPKRRCLQLWSPELGARSQTPQKVLPFAQSMWWHDGAIYHAAYDPSNPSSILRWKPGDPESQALAGRGARVNGVNDLSPNCDMSVSPEGNIFVVDYNNQRLLKFENGSGNVVLCDVQISGVCCSPSGSVYILNQDGRAVEKFVGTAFHPLISSGHLTPELQFDAVDLCVTNDEVIYIADGLNNRVLRIKPGEAEPVVGEAPHKENSELRGLLVTEDDKVYVAGQPKVWTFRSLDRSLVRDR